MIDLLPCPFCGGQAKMIYDGYRAYGYRVQCVSCEAEAGGTRYKNDEWNAERWNTRVPVLKPRSEMEKTEN